MEQSKKPIVVDSIREPNINLTFGRSPQGNITVSMPLRDPGNSTLDPLLQITRANAKELLGGAQTDLLVGLGSNATFGPIKLNGKVAGNVTYGVGTLSFEIGGTQDIKPGDANLEKLRDKIERKFDDRRKDIYAEEMKDIYDRGGAIIPMGEGKRPIKISANVAANYYNENREEYWDKQPGPAKPALYRLWPKPEGLIKDGDKDGKLEPIEGSNSTKQQKEGDGNLHFGKHQEQFSQLTHKLSEININTKASPSDVAANLLVSTINEKFDFTKPIDLVKSTKDDTLFATQGSGPSALRAAVEPTTVTPGSAQSIAKSETFTAVETSKASSLQGAIATEEQPNKVKTM